MAILRTSQRYHQQSREDKHAQTKADVAERSAQLDLVSTGKRSLQNDYKSQQRNDQQERGKRTAHWIPRRHRRTLRDASPSAEHHECSEEEQSVKTALQRLTGEFRQEIKRNANAGQCQPDIDQIIRIPPV